MKWLVFYIMSVAVTVPFTRSLTASREGNYDQIVPHSFTYQVASPETGNFQGHTQHRDAEGRVWGAYYFLGSDGLWHETIYVDRGFGFSARNSRRKVDSPSNVVADHKFSTYHSGSQEDSIDKKSMQDQLSDQNKDRGQQVSDLANDISVRTRNRAIIFGRPSVTANQVEGALAAALNQQDPPSLNEGFVRTDNISPVDLLDRISSSQDFRDFFLLLFQNRRAPSRSPNRQIFFRFPPILPDRDSELQIINDPVNEVVSRPVADLELPGERDSTTTSDTISSINNNLSPENIIDNTLGSQPESSPSVAVPATDPGFEDFDQLFG